MDKIELAQYKTFETITEPSGNKIQKEYFGNFATPNNILDVICGQELVTPEINVKWNIYKNDGITLYTTSTNKTLTVETGFKVKPEIDWKWVKANNKAIPDSTSFTPATNTNFDTNLPDSNVLSNKYIPSSLISKNTTYTRKLLKNMMVPQVKDNILIKPESGTQLSKEATCKVDFRYRTFIGKTSNSNPINKTGLTDNGLVTSKAKTVTSIITNAGEYYCYMYPKALGTLTKIIQNGATPVLAAFRQTEINIINDSGASIPYYVYTSVNSGAFKNVELAFS